MFATNYPLLGAIWTMVFLGIFVILLYLLFWIFADIFRSPDLGGLARALWMLFIIVVPFIGILAYVGWRGHAMSERDIKAARARRLERDAVSGTSSTSWYDL
jgi:type VI protein secretion system component VasK